MVYSAQVPLMARFLHVAGHFEFPEAMPWHPPWPVQTTPFFSTRNTQNSFYQGNYINKTMPNDVGSTVLNINLSKVLTKSFSFKALRSIALTLNSRRKS
jgi:hypothetical protein